ncbi:MAG: hypothetical protein IJK89_11675 [Clostridia bacterium]|nr:hypothetical protein [Clostridia bacterium]
MRIVTVNEFRVEVTLSPEELREFDITYEQLDYADADTRRVLWTLLAEVRRMNGVALDVSGKLLIEVTKETDGSCRVCFTSLPQKEGQIASVKQLVKTEAEPVVLECADLDDAVRAAQAGKTDAPGALYRLGSRYRLILSVPSDEWETAALRICEFGELPPDPLLCAAECAELWQCVIPEGAVELLRKLC